MRTNNSVMLAAGLAPACEVARYLGKSLSTVHRMVTQGCVKGVRDGRALYIDIVSLIAHYKGNIPMTTRVKELREWAKSTAAEHAVEV